MTIVNGPWRPLQIQLRKTWSALTDDDLRTIARDNRELVNVVQRRGEDQQRLSVEADGQFPEELPGITQANRGDGHRCEEGACGPRVTNLIERMLS